MNNDTKVKSGTHPTISISFPKDERDHFIQLSNEMVESVAKVSGTKPNKSLLWQTVVSQGEIVASMESFVPQDGVTYLVVPLG